MSSTFIVIGSGPCDETVAQVHASGYAEAARSECARFIDAIRAKLGAEPEGASLGIKRFEHDYGAYYEVVCHYQEGDQAAMDYAYKCESESPATWDDVTPLNELPSAVKP